MKEGFYMNGLKKEKSCGAVVFVRGSEGVKYIMIQQRLGHWCFPKGHVEGSETEQETALREIGEETGLKVRIEDGFRHELEYSPKTGVWKKVVYFLAERCGGELRLQPEEVSDCRECSFDEAMKLITYENDRQLLLAADKFISSL